MERHHVLITGTGRAGTSFLVQLLTGLGVDTGFSKGDLRDSLSEVSRAGLEITDPFMEGAPYLLKSPLFCDRMDEILAAPELVIDHVFIPMRDLGSAAASRRRVSSASWDSRGGLWKTLLPWRQEAVLLDQFYQLMLACSRHQVPVTLLNFPQFIHDPAFLFSKLSPLLAGVERERFDAVFHSLVRPDWVHDFGASSAAPSPARKAAPAPAPSRHRRLVRRAVTRLLSLAV